MDDRVADLEFGEILQPVVEAGLLGRFAPGAARRAGEQFGFGDEGEGKREGGRGKGKTGVQRGDAKSQWRIAGEESRRGRRWGSGFRPCSANIAASVSRRPAVSATSRTRPAKPAR
jgi:hypothetical protein